MRSCVDRLEHRRAPVSAPRRRRPRRRRPARREHRRAARRRASRPCRARQEAGEDRDELLSVSHTVRVRPETLVVDELGSAETSQRRRTAGRFRPRPSARRRGWGTPGTARPSGTPFPARSGPCRLRGSRRGGTRCSRGPSRRATCRRRRRARPLTLEQRGDDAERGPHPGPHVDERRADADAGRPGSPVMLMSPPAACMSASYPGSVRERPDAPVRADRAVDEPRVARAEGVRPRARAAPRGQVAGSGGRRRRRRRAAGRRRARARRSSETASERLPGVHREEHRALAVPEGRPPGAAVVAGVRPLDLHHVRSERGQDLGAVRARRSTSSRRLRAYRRAGGTPSGESSPSLRGMPPRACRDAGSTSDQIADWVSGAWWSYFVDLRRSPAVDAFFPLVPSETVVDHRRQPRGSQAISASRS